MYTGSGKCNEARELGQRPQCNQAGAREERERESERASERASERERESSRKKTEKVWSRLCMWILAHKHTFLCKYTHECWRTSLRIHARRRIHVMRRIHGWMMMHKSREGVSNVDPCIYMYMYECMHVRTFGCMYSCMHFVYRRMMHWHTHTHTHTWGSDVRKSLPGARLAQGNKSQATAND